MREGFQLFVSMKSGLFGNQKFVVVGNGYVCLRIVGDAPNWNLLTATADEDHGGFEVFPDRIRLVESALRLCAEHGERPKVDRDRLGREYVRIGTITHTPGEASEDFRASYNDVLTRFFEIFDRCTDMRSRGASEMRALYETLAYDDKCEDVYLSDGVWLKSDGSLDDRGRE